MMFGSVVFGGGVHHPAFILYIKGYKLSTPMQLSRLLPNATQCEKRPKAT